MSSALFAKMVVMVLAVGSTAVGVLALRQSRLQAAHEAAQARLNMRQHAERTMELRNRIAARVSPEALAMYAVQADMVPAIEARPPEDNAFIADPERGLEP